MSKKLCSICLEEDNKEFTKTNCNHEFHKTCLKKWTDKCNNCPICRAPFTNFYKVKLYNESYKNKKCKLFINNTYFLLKGINCKINSSFDYTILKNITSNNRTYLVLNIFFNNKIVSYRIYSNKTVEIIDSIKRSINKLL